MLVQETIKKEIKAAFEAVMDDDGDRNEALDLLSQKIAVSVINAIKSMDIIYDQVSLTAPPTGGPVTGTFNYTIQ